MIAAVSPMNSALAQEARQTVQPNTVGEIVVTASRREETVTNLPFNISAYGGEQMARANVTDVASLTRQVPNFTVQDNGARTAASAIPIIRGLNASQPVVSSARYFQSPVGFYLGNAPITGALPLFDIARVEVLRGPQGTLYGAGSLSGAVRIVPVDPNLGEMNGLVTVSAGAVAHSAEPSYSIGAAVNIPLGDTVAFRINAKHQYEAGFIDGRDILRRVGDTYTGAAPMLANPMDVPASPGVYFDEKDFNSAETTSARFSMLWEPTDAFSLTLAYNYAKSEGVGGNLDNPSFKGGPSPIDPRKTLRPSGEYERSMATLEPWERRTQLATLDASYDLGFATLATTLAYGKSKGQVVNDSTQNLLGTPYAYYYTGIPANPRVVIPVANPDEDRSYTQEVRLVSEAGGLFEYTVGAFFQQQKRYIGLYVYTPGGDIQSSAANGGNMVPIVLGGRYIPLRPDGSSYAQDTFQDFKEASVYGDLTWNINERWKVTGGARFFKQDFKQHLVAESTLFLFTVDSTSSTDATDQIFKLNTSYRWNDSNQVYATWSQGFRRGGSNAFPTDGPVQEPASLLVYDSDRTDNFEVGAKGTMFGLYYSASAFYIKWDKPQIDLLTPVNLAPVVANGSEAESKGIELELQGRVGPPGLSFVLGVAYAKARLSDDFVLPAGNGAGGINPTAIVGKAGDRLPGAPDFSGAGNVTYVHDFAAGDLTYALGFDFRSSTINQLPNFSRNSPSTEAAPYILFNGSVGYRQDDWNIELYGANLADTRVRYATNVRSPGSQQILGNWGNAYVVSRPREIGIRVTRRW